MQRLHPYVKKIFILILILAPPVYAFYLVNLYGVDVPFHDEWEFAILLVKAHTKTLTFSDLWAQHNEHRLLFPRLIMLPLARLSNWNLMCWLYANLLIAGLTFLTLYFLLRSTFQNQVKPWLLVVTSFLIFSPIQWENWLGGLSTLFFLNVLSLVAAIYAMNRWSGQWRGLVVAMACAIIASYSTNNGLLAWIVVAPLFIRKGWRKEHIIAWIAAFVVTVTLYYWGYKKPSYHPSLIAFIHRPYDFAKFVLAYLGSPLGRGCGTRCGVCVGASLLIVMGAGIIYLWVNHREKIDKLLPWFAIGLYVFLTDLATGVGRIGFGLKESLSDKYTTFSTLFTISAIVVATLLASHYRKNNHRLPAKFSAVTVSILLPPITFYALSAFHGVMTFKSNKMLVDSGRLCLLDVDSAPDECLKIFYPDPTGLRNRVKMLNDAGLLKRMYWYKAIRTGG